MSTPNTNTNTYPSDFEQKIGFCEIRDIVKSHCMSTLGKDRADTMAFSTSHGEITAWLGQVGEMASILATADDLPLNHFHDMRAPIARLRLANTHLDEKELHDLARSLSTTDGLAAYFKRGACGADGEEKPLYPNLAALTHGVDTFPDVVRRIDVVIDKYGRIKDSASAELAAIRRQLSDAAGSVSRALTGILRAAQAEGLVEKDAAPTMRDGRLVIPVAPGLKRRIRGIVHDESASGRTVFIEPAEVVEANNRIRSLEAEQRREEIRILNELSAHIRPLAPQLLRSYAFLAEADFVKAKAETAREMGAVQPGLSQGPAMDWRGAVHPLLLRSLQRKGLKAVPLDIWLTREKPLLIISGPNAGGKSVCLKTVGLLQYMLQCGLHIPVGGRSQAGIFQSLMIDIGDEQSIENDLSTYSSHLVNMKNMIRRSTPGTLILIDEFGTGTEPLIGGAIAEAVLTKLCGNKVWGVITTHYQNLKRFAETHGGVENGAMLYDRNRMQALFQLQIGQPGSSFAIEIARKSGLPEEVIAHASEIVGSDYIQSDKYLQDIIRDKKYWETKRQQIRQREKELERAAQTYEAGLEELRGSRREVIARAKLQAEELLAESNRRVENTIREIRESQAEKEQTKLIRRRLQDFKDEVAGVDESADDERIARKMEQIRQRAERREKRKRDKEAAVTAKAAAKPTPAKAAEPIAPGDHVRIKGLSAVGTVMSVEGATAVAVFGGMKTKLRVDRLEKAGAEEAAAERTAAQPAKSTRAAIDERKSSFTQDIDIRGMRADEALAAVQYFIDDAILLSAARVRILHGKGNGILRQLVRQYLATVPAVEDYRDEHVQFGGSGITVVDLG